MRLRTLIAGVVLVLSALIMYVGRGISSQNLEGYAKVSGMIIFGFGMGGVMLSLALLLIKDDVFLTSLKELGHGPGLPLPRSWHRPILVCFFGLLSIGCIYLLGKALFTGAIRGVWGGARVHFAQQPLAFIFHFALWSALGAAFVRICGRAARQSKDADRPQSIRDASDDA